jgi:hypothetical protein
MRRRLRLCSVLGPLYALSFLASGADGGLERLQPCSSALCMNDQSQLDVSRRGKAEASPAEGRQSPRGITPRHFSSILTSIFSALSRAKCCC